MSLKLTFTMSQFLFLKKRETCLPGSSGYPQGLTTQWLRKIQARQGMFIEPDFHLCFHCTSIQNSTDRSRPEFFHHIRITSFQVSGQPFDEQITQRSQKYTFIFQMLTLNELIMKPFKVVLLLCKARHVDNTKNIFQNGTWKMIYIREKINIFAL